tara:strand:+ start:2741 stop:2932 length:192 start_codon:yes stop_codon:yes gene_type:complete
MNALQAHKALQTAIDLMGIVATDTSRALVLELLAAYNALALNSGCYQQLKNAGNGQDIWIIAA